jgi:uncharacterized protein YjaZ
MYSLPSQPNQELVKWLDRRTWLKAVLKPVNKLPHLVVHELIHFQQRGIGITLRGASIKEGSADFLAELISGSHANQHIHDYANPREEELWREFKKRMKGISRKGWLYSSNEGRPNDLGYWMGYKIVKAYYDQEEDKEKAIRTIIRTRNYKKLLRRSGYAKKFGEY